MPHGKITLHIDLDHEVVKTYLAEGVPTLKAALTKVLTEVQAKVDEMEDVDLNDINTYDVVVSYELEDTAQGIEEPKPSSREELLMFED